MLLIWLSYKSKTDFRKLLFYLNHQNQTERSLTKPTVNLMWLVVFNDSLIHVFKKDCLV